jgi:hypothetical protein
LCAWTYDGSLYTASIHRDPAVGRAILLGQLDRILASLERIDPTVAADGPERHMS